MASLYKLGPRLAQALLEAQENALEESRAAALAVSDLQRYQDTSRDVLDKIPKGPYTYSTTDGLLAGILLGGQAMGFETVPFSNSAAQLTPPDGAIYAVIVCEADASDAPQTVVARFRQDGAVPTGSSGHPLGHLGQIEIKGIRNMQNFRVTGIRAGKNHRLQVQYFI